MEHWVQWTLPFRTKRAREPGQGGREGTSLMGPRLKGLQRRWRGAGPKSWASSLCQNPSFHTTGW